MNNPHFFIYKSGSDCIYIMSLFWKHPLQLLIHISLRSEKNIQKIKKHAPNWVQKLVGNPRSSPMEKINDLWKTFFYIMCPFYKDVMRFFWLFVFRCERICRFCFSPLNFWTAQKCCIQMYVVLTSSQPSLHLAVIISFKVFKIIFRPSCFAALEMLLWFIFFLYACLPV